MLVEVRSARTRPTRRRRLTILEAKVADDTGVATAIWFNRGWLAERLTPGTRLLARGKLEKRGFTVSEHELLEGPGTRAPAGLHTTGIVAVHPASEKLRAQRLREWAWQTIPLALHAVEPLPARVRTSRRMPGAADALVVSHFPRSEADAAEARRRLAFEELFLYQAALAARRARHRDERRHWPCRRAASWWSAGSRRSRSSSQGTNWRALDEIDADLAAEAPMQRLLMGEVGSAARPWSPSTRCCARSRPAIGRR